MDMKPPPAKPVGSTEQAESSALADTLDVIERSRKELDKLQPNEKVEDVTPPSDSWFRLRRFNQYEPPTLLDQLLSSPITFIVSIVYHILLYLRGAPFQNNRLPTIRVVCISDTHDNKPQIPDGDLLIHCGDLTNSGSFEDIQAQLDWLESLPHRHKMFIAGNHDSYFDGKSRRKEDRTTSKRLNIHKLRYLQDQSITLKFKGNRRLSIYGAGDIPACGGDDFAFQYQRDDAPWKNRIPHDTDILVTHTPPRHHLDVDLGCSSLLAETWRVRPRLHVFGHIHSGHGREAVFWDEGQAAYENLLARSGNRNRNGFIWDFVPGPKWLDAVRVLWYGVKGVLWQRLMVGPQGRNGGLMVNAALVWRTTTQIGNPVEVVDI